MKQSEETFSDLIKGLEQITLFERNKIDIATHHQNLISTMRETETKIILQQIKKDNIEQETNALVETFLNYEKTILTYDESAVMSNEHIGLWGITLTQFDEKKLKDIHNMKIEEICMRAREEQYPTSGISGNQ